MSRIWVDKGYLIQTSIVSHGGRDYEVPLETQVFGLDGAPMGGSYRGEGFIEGRKIILGDVSKPHSFLAEYLLDLRPTRESLQFLEGFKKGLADRKQVASFALPKSAKAAAPYIANPVRWWDGYIMAWEERRRLQRGERGMYLAEPGRAAGRAPRPRRR